MRRARLQAIAATGLVGLLGLTGCASAEGGSLAAESPREATHTMSDGSVMGGESHEDHADHEGDHGEDHDESGHEAHEAKAGGPSETASMICGGQVAEDVNRIMGEDPAVEPTSRWKAPMFTCTFDLAQGPIVLTVHDATDEQAGEAYFEGLRAGDAQAEPLKGLYGLGLPAFATDRGTAVFVRDGKTLSVDATALPTGNVSATGDQDRRDVAYEVASSVLACWTAHS